MYDPTQISVNDELTIDDQSVIVTAVWNHNVYGGHFIYVRCRPKNREHERGDIESIGYYRKEYDTKYEHVGTHYWDVYEGSSKD